VKFHSILFFSLLNRRVPFFSWNSIDLEAAYLPRLERNRFGLDTSPDNWDCKTPSSLRPRWETSRRYLARASFGVAASRRFSGTPSWSSCSASLGARTSRPSALSAHITWSHIWIYKRKSRETLPVCHSCSGRFRRAEIYAYDIGKFLAVAIVVSH